MYRIRPLDASKFSFMHSRLDRALRIGTTTVLSLLLSSCSAAMDKTPQEGQKADRMSGTADSSTNSANIARGCNVSFSVTPEYPLTKDADDAKQLTDGRYSPRIEASDPSKTTALWGQVSTVGWVYTSQATITIDLGKVQPISGLSFSTAAGEAGVTWPQGIYLGVSEDGNTWHYIGDLVRMSRENGIPPAEGYALHRYITHRLQTKARYVALAVKNTPYIFSDEIEVYGGAQNLQHLPVQRVVTGDFGKFIKENTVLLMMQRRIYDDVERVRAAIDSTVDIPPVEKIELQRKLTLAEAAVGTLTQPDPTTFTTVLPLNRTHSDVLAIYGELLDRIGVPSLAVWKQHRFAWLPLLPNPTAIKAASDTARSKTNISVEMLRNETRADAFLLTNATREPMDVRIKVVGLPGGAHPSYMEISGVAWTDTVQSVPVASALPPAPFLDGTYRISIPAGMTRKVWITVDSKNLPPGSYNGILEITDRGARKVIPIKLRVSHVAMSTPRLSLGMFDYTNGSGVLGVTPRNMSSALKQLKSHLVNVTWATRTALPWPVAADFDDKDNLRKALNFSEFDEWVNRWPDAAYYMVYVRADAYPDFAGAKIGSAEFDRRVGTWAKSLSQHMRSLNIPPRKLGFLLVDEPQSAEQLHILLPWAEAIHKSAPELTQWQDPNWIRPDQMVEKAEYKANFEILDILTPHLNFYYEGGEPARKFYEQQRLSGKELWLYHTIGPARLNAPGHYYRELPWHVFKAKGTGLAIWAFADTPNSSWNEYLIEYLASAPAFIGPTEVTDSIQWQAIREGVEDYEYLSLLRDKASLVSRSKQGANSKQVIAEAVTAVLSGFSTRRSSDWRVADQPERTDEQRLRVLRLLEQKE